MYMYITTLQGEISRICTSFRAVSTGTGGQAMYVGSLRIIGMLVLNLESMKLNLVIRMLYPRVWFEEAIQLIMFSSDVTK